MFSHLLDKNGLPSSRKMTRVGALDKLIEYTNWMRETATPAERLYCAQHNILEYKKFCKMCITPVKFTAWGPGYIDTFCSRACQYANMRAKPKKVKDKQPLLSEEEKQQRREKTSIERHGVPNYLMSDEYKYTRQKTDRIKFGQSFLDLIIRNEKLIPLFAVEDYRDQFHPLPVRCLICENVFTLAKNKYPTDGRLPCPTCYTPNASKGQHSLADWIKSLGVQVKINDRKIFAGRHEIDLYIASHNLAIEYDGLYWHSERGRPDIKEKSKEKRQKITALGIKLIEIFEDDWLLRTDIIKSRIKNALGLIDVKIYARKCKIINLSNLEYQPFMEKSHLQGYISADKKIGLEYNGTLVAAMSFATSRFDKKFDWELLQFATLPDMSIIGGASRLFKHWYSLNRNASIVSFADNRWSVGRFYDKLGFHHDGETPQRYFYINSNGIRRSRSEMIQCGLEKQLKTFDSTLTERENCWNNGWYRVWDQGHTRWKIS